MLPGNGSNWDFGFSRWRLINNSVDLEMEKGDGSKMVLRNWQASATGFMYTISMGTYEVNYLFKYHFADNWNKGSSLFHLYPTQ